VTDPTAVYREIVLQRVQLYATNVVPTAILRHLKAEAHLSHVADEMIIRLSAQILGETVPEVDVTFPVTWWDAVKDRWFPRWSLRWFPVEYRRVTVDKHTLFPSIEVPGHEAHICVTNRDFRWWDYGKDDE
jgi:hypothetical protein